MFSFCCPTVLRKCEVCDGMEDKNILDQNDKDRMSPQKCALPPNFFNFFETVALDNQTQQDVEEFLGGRADAFAQLVLQLQVPDSLYAEWIGWDVDRVSFTCDLLRSRRAGCSR